MKKLLLSASAIVLAATCTTSAQAECDGWYFGARGGIVKHDISGGNDGIIGSSTNKLDDDRLMLAAALGYRYEHLRGEFEYVWRRYSTETDEDYKEKFKSYSFMLNAYYDFLPYNWWTPYVGAGIGLTQLKYSANDTASGQLRSTDGNYKPLNFTWSVGAGLSIKVTNRFNVDAGYRYYDMHGIRHADITAQEIYGGIRYVF